MKNMYKVYCYTLGNEFILGEYPELTTAIEKGKEWLGNNIIPNGKNSWKNDDGDKICIE